MKPPRTGPPPAGGRCWRAAVLLVAASLLAACAVAPGGGGASDRAAIAAAGDRLFHADPRWLGGDAAITVPLSDGRILWLFGDSFVDLQPPYRRDQAAFIRNAAAIQTGADPARAAMRFVWRGGAGGEPASFFPEPAPAKGQGKSWYWPGDGIRLNDGALAIILHRFAETGGPPGLNFAARGYALALIANPDADPADWALRIVDGPALPFDALPGAAVLRDDGHVVALAVRQAGKPAGMLVRWTDAALAAGDLAQAEWWAGPGQGWVGAAALGGSGPGVVIDDAGAESSIQRDACGFVHVASYGFGAADIRLRRAPALTGPWSAPRVVYRPPESDGPAPFVYAAKAHDGLQTSGLAITYVASSLDPAALTTPAGQSTLYWPRLVTIKNPACP